MCPRFADPPDSRATARRAANAPDWSPDGQRLV
jgi:hypothetical protein